MTTQPWRQRTVLRRVFTFFADSMSETALTSPRSSKATAKPRSRATFFTTGPKPYEPF